MRVYTEEQERIIFERLRNNKEGSSLAEISRELGIPASKIKDVSREGGFWNEERKRVACMPWR